MRIDRQKSSLLLIDVQEKLTPLVHDSQRLLARIAWLLGVAKTLQIPVQYSEQYPQGLGKTVEELKPYLSPQPDMTKVHFSCADDKVCLNTINALQRDQVIVMGIEAHVCVLQTALGLKACGKQVFVVADAVSSRSPFDLQAAISRLKHSDIEIVSREMVAFEWLQQSASEEFRQVSQEYLKRSMDLT